MLKLFITTFSLIILTSTLVVFAPAEKAMACIGEGDNGTNFFELPSWHEYLQCGPGGEGVVITEQNGELNIGSLWLIGVAVLEILIRLSALGSVAFIIYGGFKYITSQGAPDATASARKTIMYSIVGFVVAIFASTGISFAMNLLIEPAAGVGQGGLPNSSGNRDTVSRVLSFIYALAGIVSVIFIAIGGLKYVISNGDPGKTANAKNTIIYAVVGLVVVLCAVAITAAVENRI